MSDVLPSTWLRLELGNVVAYGSTEKAEPESISSETWVLELEDIEKDTSRIIQKLTFAERQSKSTKNRFEKGDVLYGKLRPYLNKVVQADRAGVCTTEIIPIKANAAVNGRFLFHWFRHPEFLTYVTEVSHGVNMPRLGTEAGRAAPFVLTPLPEQKRIADKLDSVLARVDACRDRLDRLPALLKRFRQSILAAATSGKLTEDWRELNLAEQEWNATKLENLCTSVFDGPFGSNLKSDDYTISGVRVVRLENIGHLYFEASKETYISDEKYQGLAKHSLQTDDIIFSSFVDEEVRVCLYPAELPTAAINKADCFCLRPDTSKCSPTYLSYRLASRATYVELKELVHGATRPRINLKQLRQYLVEVPELEEQTEIVRRVELLFAFADRLEARLATARRQVGQLTPALLAKAFRGELVPQDPADEPAAELLKRLAAQREAAPKAKRGRAKA